VLVDYKFLNTLGINSWKVRQNKQQIIIAEQHGQSLWIYPEINDKSLQEFLHKILSACNCKQTSKAIELLNTDGIYNEPYEFDCSNIDYYVIFGIALANMPWINLSNRKNIIELPNLESLSTNTEKKKQAWYKLKILKSSCTE
jgi:hypothetical protein